MRRLSSLCRKLRRIGVDVIVVTHSRGNYRIHMRSLRPGISYPDYHDCSSVRECEQYLLTLFL